MNWFIIHSLKSFSQHPNLIGSAVKTVQTRKEPKYKNFKKIEIGDRIVYYSTGSCVIVGLFNVISNLNYVKNDDYWGEVVTYEIEPIKLPPINTYLNFKKLYRSSKVRFDFIPKVKHWGVYLLGKICIPISLNDYSIIEKAIIEPDFLEHKEYVKKEKI